MSVRMMATLLGVAVVLSACADQSPSSPRFPDKQPSVIYPSGVRVYRNPYAAVNWTKDLMVKAQHHDHMGLGTKALQAYDAAGYNVMAYMDYSGVASMSYAWHERHWPAEDWLPAKTLAWLKNVKLLVPSGEEVGQWHMTSPFMKQYIALWEPAYYAKREPWHYSTDLEAVSLINLYGGVPIIAHPWLDDPVRQGAMHPTAGGMEIYSAYVTYRWKEGVFPSDLNIVMVKNWDRGLMVNQRLLGLGVNDHFGPGQTNVAADIRDSGKILVWVPSLTAANYEAAFRAGAMVAVKDIGHLKDKLPKLQSIAVTDSTVKLAVAGSFTAVKWIANGTAVGSGLVLDLRKLPETTVYVRAEIVNAEGSVLYTQAFSMRRFGDANGDGVVDTADQAVCAAVAAGTDRIQEHVSACRR